ncbi:MAG: ABC transporter permease subunit [Leptolyngbya sp. SIO1E4]|nr:ABC transporter permease subunit [Leptolyngbya sp. SIO1E4]
MVSKLSPPRFSPPVRQGEPSNVLRRLRAGLVGLVSLSLLLWLWQWGAEAYTPVILPPPRAVGIALQRLVLTGDVFPPIAATLFHVLAGFGLALLGGGLLGIAAGNQPLFRQAIAPIASALLGTPPIAWLVLAMVWFGLGSPNSIFTVAVTVGPIVFTGAADAIGTLNPQLLGVAQVYQLRGWVRFQALYWPYLVSQLLPLLVAGLSLAWRVAIMSEVLATPSGIGAELNTARANLDTAEVMAWIVIIILLVLASDGLLRRIQQCLLPWQQAQTLQPRLGE